MNKTEFFEIAVQQGFYGLTKGGLHGKKDNVRKYWEDISIKTAMRKPIQNLLIKKNRLKIIDLGCGSGEGYELLTHIPPANSSTVQHDFVLPPELIEEYIGIDISKGMIEQGQKNYSGSKNISFLNADIANTHEFLERAPSDVYFSSYSSPSHLQIKELYSLLDLLFRSNNDCFIIALDLFGKYSPEWPVYWHDKSTSLLPYNMKWLYKPDSDEAENVDDYYVMFWDADELRALISKAGLNNDRKFSINIKDRSILVGRHMDTGYYNKYPQTLRYEVNRLFDRDYRGTVEKLYSDISFLHKFEKINPKAYERIEFFHIQWNLAIAFLEALMTQNETKIQRIITEAQDGLREELHMLNWLEKNSSRFPVVDFWASVMGPQIACVLRNLEINLPEGTGCGHGLFCVVEVERK